MNSVPLLHESLADESPHIRQVVPDEARVVAGLINEAFTVEAFFKIGDRTSAHEVVQMTGDGEFLVLEEPRGAIAGCVYLTFHRDRAYFGMLSIAPSRQGRGFGRRLIDAVEARARERGL